MKHLHCNALLVTVRHQILPLQKRAELDLVDGWFDLRYEDKTVGAYVRAGSDIIIQKDRVLSSVQ